MRIDETSEDQPKFKSRLDTEFNESNKISVKFKSPIQQDQVPERLDLRTPEIIDD